MNIKVLLISIMIGGLAACGGNTNTRSNNSSYYGGSAEPATVNGKINVTSSNLKQLFPEREVRKKFVGRTMGPFTIVYNECVYYEATLADDNSRNIVSVVKDAQQSCRRYLRLVASWMGVISKRSKKYNLATSYKRLILTAVIVVSRTNTIKLINKRRNGEYVRKPRNPDVLMEKIRRRTRKAPSQAI